MKRNFWRCGNRIILPQMSLKGGTGIKVHQIVSLVRNFLQKRIFFNFTSASPECVHGMQKSLKAFELIFCTGKKESWSPGCQISQVNDWCNVWTTEYLCYPGGSNPLRPSFSFSCLNLGKGNTRLHTSICLPIAIPHMTDADICTSPDVNCLMSSPGHLLSEIFHHHIQIHDPRLAKR